MNKEIKQKLQQIEEQMIADNRVGDLSRARSITVGTSFGGVTEIMMRGNNGYMWTPMQPVEVVELINQLAANIGCHIALKPKKDFASWRDWRVTEEEKAHLNGHAPFVNDMAPFMQVGINGIHPKLEQALAAGGKILEAGGGVGGGFIKEINEGGAAGVSAEELIRRRKQNVMATKEPKNRRSSKRTAKAA